MSKTEDMSECEPDLGKQEIHRLRDDRISLDNSSSGKTRDRRFCGLGDGRR